MRQALADDGLFEVHGTSATVPAIALAPEVLAVIVSGLGFRSLARRTVGVVPIVGWVLKGGYAYVGTRALGEAAMRYFERRAPVTRVAGDRTLFPR